MLDDLGDVAQGPALATHLGSAHEPKQAGCTQRLDVLAWECPFAVYFGGGWGHNIGDNAFERVTKDWSFNSGNSRRHVKTSW